MQHLERSVATLLYTDIVGSTERLAQLGDRGYRKLRSAHDARVRRELRRFGGRELSTSGDGFLARFEEPAPAIACAAAIRDSVREVGLEIRSGLHMGEVEGAGATIGGLAVHIGARIGAAADRGEILVSSTMRDALAGSSFEFENRGAHSLKGVPGAWQLYAVTGVPEEASTPAGRWPGRTPRSLAFAAAGTLALLLAGAGLLEVTRRGPSSAESDATPAPGAESAVAVLPFTVRDPQLGAWREGLVDVLSTNLDGVGGVRAIDSRTVLARWQDAVGDSSRADLATSLEVARAAGARYAVMGSALSTPSQVRFVADVYDVQRADRVARAQVVGSPDSLMVLIDRLSIEILGTLPSVEGERHDVARLPSAMTESVGALRTYLEGERHFREGDFELAANAYERAVEADSTFALALYRLSVASQWVTTRPPELAMANLERAAGLADRLPPREELMVRAELALAHGSPERIRDLEQAVLRHPQDVELRYVLGDSYLHMGEQALIPLGEVRRTFAKAVELDPTYMPAFLHLIHTDFVYRPDRARLASLLERFGSLDPPQRDERLNWIGLDLAFGTGAARAAAVATLDTLPLESLDALAQQYVVHPLFVEANRQVVDVVERRSADDWAAWVRYRRYVQSVARGSAAGAVRAREWQGMGESWSAMGIYNASLWGLPVPAETLERHLSVTALDSAPGLQALYAGAYAADRGRWDTYEAAVRRLGVRAPELLAAGDSVGARLIAAWQESLQGYGEWKRAGTAEAIWRIRSGQQRSFGSPQAQEVSETLRWWIATALLASSQPAEAERYFQALWYLPPAYLQLAKLREKHGDPEEAAYLYDVFVTSWRDADPELQPLVEQARAARTRLDL